jgi:glutaredoxin 3
MKKIEIYSTPSCHFCHMAKDFFESHDLSFEDYDVASDTVKRSEMMEKSGQMGVPVIVIDGQDVVIGFDRERLASLLEVEA